MYKTMSLKRNLLLSVVLYNQTFHPVAYSHKEAAKDTSEDYSAQSTLPFLFSLSKDNTLDKKLSFLRQKDVFLIGWNLYF